VVEGSPIGIFIPDAIVPIVVVIPAFVVIAFNVVAATFTLPFKFTVGVTDLKSNGGAMLVFIPFEDSEETFIKFPVEGVENPEDPIDTVLVVVNLGRVAEIFGASTFGIPAISSDIHYFPTNARVLCNVDI
jgi:hypothetical protein